MDLLDLAIQKRLTDPDTDLDELVKPLMSARQAYEGALVWRIQQSHGQQQAAAIDLLGRLGSQRSVPFLVELSRRAAPHTSAARALARLADSDTLGQLAGAETDAELQQEWFAALLARHDRRSVEVYLSFVGKRDTSEAAIAALERAGNPPVEQWFMFLDSPHQSQRLAAAVVLGQLRDPAVSKRLIQMVIRDVMRREALVALVASPEQEAWQFVSLARRDPSLTGSIYAAQSRLRTMFP